MTRSLSLVVGLLGYSMEYPKPLYWAPLVFCLYKRATKCCRELQSNLYADDTVMITEGIQANDLKHIGEPDLDLITDWCVIHRLTISSGIKTMQVIYIDITKVKSFCYLGVNLDENLTMKPHIPDVMCKNSLQFVQNP